MEGQIELALVDQALLEWRPALAQIDSNILCVTPSRNGKRMISVHHHVGLHRCGGDLGLDHNRNIHGMGSGGMCSQGNCTC